jgi:hypothetical protein
MDWAMLCALPPSHHLVDIHHARLGMASRLAKELRSTTIALHNSIARTPAVLPLVMCDDERKNAAPAQSLRRFLSRAKALDKKPTWPLVCRGETKSAPKSMGVVNLKQRQMLPSNWEEIL